LEHFDISVAEAESSSQCAKTCDAIFARRFCSEQLRPTFLSDTSVGHGYLESIDTLQQNGSLLQGAIRLHQSKLLREKENCSILARSS
jgi:hypothetical protein